MTNRSEISCLHPDVVEEVVEDLLSSDIISKDKIEKLKNDCLNILDPNVVMDVRHKEAKKKSLIDFDKDGVTFCSSVLKRSSKESSQEKLAVKDLKTIDKEIANTRKTLKFFQKQLAKKSESFMTSLDGLDKKPEPRPSMYINLNPEETKEYSNMLVETLEDLVVENVASMWKPLEAAPSPTVSVVTSLSVTEIEESTINFEREELEMVAMCQMNSIRVTGKVMKSSPLEFVESQKEKERNNIVPNNTPSLYPNEYDYSEVETNMTRQREETIVKRVKEKWKLFIKNSKEKRVERENIEKLKIRQRAFTSWLIYVKWQKAKKKANSSYECKNKSYIVADNGNKPYLKKEREQRRKCLEIQKNNLDCIIDSLSSSTCPRKLKSDVVSVTEVSQQSPDKNKPTPGESLKYFPKLTEEAKINNITIRNPERFGLLEFESHDVKSKVPEPADSHSVEEKTTVVLNEIGKMKNYVLKPDKSKKKQELYSNRFAAKEKIIAQQLEVIEKQKQIILDLQAQNLETQSLLSLQKVENELAKVNCDKKLKPIVKISETQGKPIVKQKDISKLEEKSEQLIKKMLERQEYCKQLAEKTRLRKIRMEEDKAKQKLEREEKERQEKEEEKRQRILKIKMEQELAKEKAEKFFAEKWLLVQKTSKAVNHYDHTIIRKPFEALKSVLVEKKLKVSECDRLYQKNLLKTVFDFWKSEAKQRILLKLHMADKYYGTKLMERSWNIWFRQHQEFTIKVLVSDNMFTLKLKERMFRRWMAFAAKQYLQNCCRMELADRLYRKQLLSRVLRHWRELPRLMFADREKEQRRRAWRQTVQQLIPDFSPVFADHLEV